MFGSVSETTAQLICWWCSVLTLSIYRTYFSCQYLFEGIVIFFGTFMKSEVYSLKHRTFVSVHAVAFIE